MDPTTQTFEILGKRQRQHTAFGINASTTPGCTTTASPPDATFALTHAPTTATFSVPITAAGLGAA